MTNCLVEVMLTQDERFAVQFEWRHMSHISVLEVALGNRQLSSYFLELAKHRVIEIGPGTNPVTDHYPCRGYTAAYGDPPNDGLSVLEKEASQSAVVVSFGVIDDSVLKGSDRNMGLSVRYIEEFVAQIKRVMNPFGMIIGHSAQKYLGNPDVPLFVGDGTFGGIYMQKHLAEAVR